MRPNRPWRDTPCGGTRPTAGHALWRDTPQGGTQPLAGPDFAIEAFRGTRPLTGHPTKWMEYALDSPLFRFSLVSVSPLCHSLSLTLCPVMIDNVHIYFDLMRTGLFTLRLLLLLPTCLSEFTSLLLSCAETCKAASPVQ